MSNWAKRKWWWWLFWFWAKIGLSFFAHFSNYSTVLDNPSSQSFHISVSHFSPLTLPNVIFHFYLFNCISNHYFSFAFFLGGVIWKQWLFSVLMMSVIRGITFNVKFGIGFRRFNIFLKVLIFALLIPFYLSF